MENSYKSKHLEESCVSLPEISNLVETLEKKVCKDFTVKSGGSNTTLLYSGKFSYNNGIDNANIYLKILNNPDKSESPCSYNPLLGKSNDKNRKKIFIESSTEFESNKNTTKWNEIFSNFVKTVYDTVDELK